MTSHVIAYESFELLFGRTHYILIAFLRILIAYLRKYASYLGCCFLACCRVLKVSFSWKLYHARTLKPLFGNQPGPMEF